MKPPFRDYELPPDKETKLRHAEKIEWTAIAFLVSIVVVMGVTMGASQAMKAMWIEDAVSLIPSVSFLLGAHFRRKSPDEQFPYGYRRAILIANLAGSLALFGVGLWILGDSVYKLIAVDRPTIPTVELFGRRIWLGWLMIAALAYSVVPPFILGRIKMKDAVELNDKTLHTSAKVDKGDFLSGIAAIIGIIGIAYGWWWADSAAAAFISFEIVNDGWSSLKNSVQMLMLKRPVKVATQEVDPVVDKVQHELEKLGWVKEAKVRLREDGDVLTGEAYVVPRDESDIFARLDHAAEVIRSIDWRLHDVSIVPTRTLA